jgi:hypothetical protein
MRHVLVKLALIGFLCRVLVPAGFMPAPLADGGPIRFCHGGAAGALLTALVEQRSTGDVGASRPHHGDVGQHFHGEDRRSGGDDSAGEGHDDHVDQDRHSDHERGANHEGWDRCPVGTAFALAALVSDFALPVLPLEHVYAASSPELLVLRHQPAHYHARAPPLV